MAAALIVVENQFPLIAAQLGAKARTVALIAAEAISSDAKSRAPVLTGRLRGSIGVSGASGAGAEVGTSVDYAIYQEYGTWKMEAHPFLRPAVEDEAAPFEILLTGLFLL